MSRVLYSVTMSLDGFIAGPAGDMSWLTSLLGEDDPTAQELLDATGSLLIGRRTWGGDDPHRGTDSEGAFGGAWSGQSFVLTHSPLPATPDTVFVADLHRAVDLARAAAGEKYVNVLGADVARQLVHAGLLDEVLTFVAPVLLGDGVRLFDDPGGDLVRLERVRVSPGPVSTALWFRVLR